MILGAAGSFVAGVVGWYTMWHRRMVTTLERVPVGTARSALIVHRDAGLPGKIH